MADFNSFKGRFGECLPAAFPTKAAVSELKKTPPQNFVALFVESCGGDDRRVCLLRKSWPKLMGFLKIDCEIPPRPSNQYVIYNAMHRQEKMKSSVGFFDQSIYVCNAWKKLDRALRIPYKLVQDYLTFIHKMYYPGYKYCPIRSKKAKSPEASEPKKSTTRGIIDSPAKHEPTRRPVGHRGKLARKTTKFKKNEREPTKGVASSCPVDDSNLAPPRKRSNSGTKKKIKLFDKIQIEPIDAISAISTFNDFSTSEAPPIIISPIIFKSNASASENFTGAKPRRDSILLCESAIISAISRPKSADRSYTKMLFSPVKATVSPLQFWKIFYDVLPDKTTSLWSPLPDVCPDMPSLQNDLGLEENFYNIL